MSDEYKFQLVRGLILLLSNFLGCFCEFLGGEAGSKVGTLGRFSSENEKWQKLLQGCHKTLSTEFKDDSRIFQGCHFGHFQGCSTWVKLLWKCSTVVLISCLAMPCTECRIQGFRGSFQNLRTFQGSYKIFTKIQGLFKDFTDQNEIQGFLKDVATLYSYRKCVTNMCRPKMFQI